MILAHCPAAFLRAGAFDVIRPPNGEPGTVEPYSIQILDSFTALRDQAPCLETPPAGTELFYTIDWFENLADHGMDDHPRLRLVLASDTRTGACFCLPLTGGTELVSLSNYYSSLYGPIGLNGSIPFDLWRAVCRRIRRDDSRWPVIDLQPLDPDSPFCRDMLAALKAEGYLADTYYRFGNWYLDVGGRSFEGYMAGLSSKLRNTIERGRKKLTREGAWSLTIHRQAGDELETAIADFERVYRHSWKQPEARSRFIGSLCRMAAARGWLRLGIVKLGEEAIAAQIWMVAGGKALIYKLAYNQLHSRFSAGSILTAALMRHVIDIDSVHEVDYLTGDEAYKRDWMSHRRERVGIVAFNPATMRGLLAAARHFAGKAVQRVRTPHRHDIDQCEPLPSSPT